MGREKTAPGDAAPERTRLDAWLDIACVCKTRSAARQACLGGKVDVNGARAKPHREIGAGDRIAITTASGRKRRLVVKAVAAQHVPKSEARALYDDVTPPRTPAQDELQDLLRLAAPPPGGRGAQDRRQRRRASARFGRADRPR